MLLGGNGPAGWMIVISTLKFLSEWKYKCMTIETNLLVATCP